jgi:hypothetical protein
MISLISKKIKSRMVKGNSELGNENIFTRGYGYLVGSEEMFVMNYNELQLHILHLYPIINSLQNSLYCIQTSSLLNHG